MMICHSIILIWYSSQELILPSSHIITDGDNYCKYGFDSSLYNESLASVVHHENIKSPCKITLTEYYRRSKLT